MGLNPNDSTKAYVQIADDLRRQIRSGEFGPGDKLPSTGDLVKRYDVANMTIQGAFRLLRDEQLIYSVQGRGTFVRDDVDLAQLEKAGDGPTAEYLALRGDLQVLAGVVDQLVERVGDLEKKAKPKRSVRAKK